MDRRRGGGQVGGRESSGVARHGPWPGLASSQGLRGGGERKAWCTLYAHAPSFPVYKSSINVRKSRQPCARKSFTDEVHEDPCTVHYLGSTSTIQRTTEQERQQTGSP